MMMKIKLSYIERKSDVLGIIMATEILGFPITIKIEDSLKFSNAGMLAVSEPSFINTTDDIDQPKLSDLVSVDSTNYISIEEYTITTSTLTNITTITEFELVLYDDTEEISINNVDELPIPWFIKLFNSSLIDIKIRDVEQDKYVVTFFLPMLVSGMINLPTYNNNILIEVNGEVYSVMSLDDLFTIETIGLKETGYIIEAVLLSLVEVDLSTGSVLVSGSELTDLLSEDGISVSIGTSPTIKVYTIDGLVSQSIENLDIEDPLVLTNPPSLITQILQPITNVIQPIVSAYESLPPEQKVAVQLVGALSLIGLLFFFLL